MPKDIPKPKPSSKPRIDPAATPPTAPSAAASQPQAAASQTKDAASQLQDAAIQPEAATSHPTGAASQPLDAVSQPQEPAATSHHASSSNTSSSSNLQDTQSSSPSIVSDETQAPVGSNGASVPKTADGVVPSTVTSTEAAVPAEQQPQQMAQATPSGDEAGKDEQQALSGSVNKSGFEFSGTGEQFKVGKFSQESFQEKKGSCNEGLIVFC